eukprot:scaffold83402_cov69-Phaeocystis_antarctica.AAC.1
MAALLGPCAAAAAHTAAHTARGDRGPSPGYSTLPGAGCGGTNEASSEPRGERLSHARGDVAAAPLLGPLLSVARRLRRLRRLRRRVRGHVRLLRVRVRARGSGSG